MKFFLDTGVLDEIKSAVQLGIIDGVTTNPTLIAKTGRSQQEVITAISELVNGPISAEVIATDWETMIQEGAQLAKIHPNVVVKIPMTPDGLQACQWFTKKQIKTNVTLVFSPNQALLAAKSGATYVSPFIGRLDDIGHDGMALIREIKTIFQNYHMPTQVLAASIRHGTHVRDCALGGADVVTMPYKVLLTLYQHPLTTSGLETFLADHKKSL